MNRTTNPTTQEVTMTAHASAAALALSAFARDITGDPAIDSVVYDLQAYDPTVAAEVRYVGISRDGIRGWFADVDAANLALLNRRGDRFYTWKGESFWSVTTIIAGGVPIVAIDEA